MSEWTTEKSAELYGIPAWGCGYFGVNEQGKFVVRVKSKSNQRSYDLYALVQSLEQRGIELPVLLRFDEILSDRLGFIQAAFDDAISEAGYSGSYRPVYPIKVNQQRHVVESILAAGCDSNLGLQVGSKAELLAVLALHDEPEALLLCNGFKDDEYIEIALLSTRIGRRPIIVIEQAHELEQALRVSDKLGIPVELGVRMRPSVRSLYKDPFITDRSKFGLGPDEMHALVGYLGDAGRQDALKLLHVHLGTQITSIATIKKALREATRMYVELARSCPDLAFLDVGGGLAVDYDGSNTNFESSMNYSVDEYARDVVYAVEETCAAANIKRPTLISESGRSLVSHHAVLVMEVVDVARCEDAVGQIARAPTAHPFLERVLELHHDLDSKDCLEVMHDVLALKEELLERFNQGDINLVERAYIEQGLRHLIAKFKQVALRLEYVPEEMQQLIATVRDLYFCNFSVFQSLPDSWAIDQLYPVVPLQNLDKEPKREAILADLSCDSDGCIDRFIDLEDVSPSVKLHEYDETKPYYVAVCLVGAYQEILGDLHNLFGDTHAIHVNSAPDGKPELTRFVEGDSVREVLSYVEFNAADLQERLRRSIEKGLSRGTLKPREAARIQKRYREALNGYTYLVKDRPQNGVKPV